MPDYSRAYIDGALPRTLQTEMCHLLCKLGFKERIRGSHHIFTKEGVEEILNLQPKGAKAKLYQVKQVRNLILRHKLGGTEGD